MAGKYLTCQHFLQGKWLAYLQGWQHAGSLVVVIFLITAFYIHFQKAVKGYHFTGSYQVFVAGGDANGYGGLLQFGIGHLAGDGTFPYQLVETGGLAVEAGTVLPKIGRPDGLVGLLGTGSLGLILAYFYILLAIGLANLTGGSGNGFLRQVGGVGTHVGNQPVFIELLCQPHSLRYRIAQLTRGFLLQGRGGKGCSRALLARFFLQVGNGKNRLFTLFQKGFGFFLVFELVR